MVCRGVLIGGGQEINTGEAGLEEWLVAIERNYANSRFIRQIHRGKQWPQPSIF
jgi:hypothetical protein